MSIKVKNLTKYYGQQQAVSGISFAAVPGRILGFLGPNGAGKTTTMRMLTGYMDASEGEIEIEGVKMDTKAIPVRKYIGYLPENTPLYTDMYVSEFLLFSAETYGVSSAREQVERVIKQVGLSGEKHKKIQELSKGYKQRVGLAQAIIHDPKVLILDEPTSGLDPNQLTEIRAVIKALGKDRTVILSTHIMQEVEAICDDIIILNKGKIVANDTLLSLKSKYAPKTMEDIFKQLTTHENTI